VNNLQQSDRRYPDVARAGVGRPAWRYGARLGRRPAL